MSEVPPVLVEAYRRDLIDLETFERFAELVIAGRPVALPEPVLALGLQLRQQEREREARQHHRELLRRLLRLLTR